MLEIIENKLSVPEKIKLREAMDNSSEFDTIIFRKEPSRDYHRILMLENGYLIKPGDADKYTYIPY